MDIHIEIMHYFKDDDPRDPWIMAKLCIDDDNVSKGHCPNSGLYKSEGIAESTAISSALSQFQRELAARATQDIRRIDGTSWRGGSIIKLDGKRKDGSSPTNTRPEDRPA
jgi:hypothetical protein